MSNSVAGSTGGRPTWISGYGALPAEPGGIRPRLTGARMPLSRAADDVRQRVAHHCLPVRSFAIAGGWVVVLTGVISIWLGWWGVVAGIALVAAQFAWTYEAAWLVSYVAFWLWLLTTCVVLIRQTPSVAR